MARERFAVALVMAVACHRDAPPNPEAAPATTPGVAAKALAEKPFYRVDRGAQAACVSGATCEAHVVLTALAGFHVNKDYPFKFVGDPAAAVTPDGPGAFALDGDQHGTLTITFRPAAPGTATLMGTFKLSVCSDNNCEIEAPKLELAVPVS